MPTWKEQIEEIQKLRIIRRENDEQLYAVKVNLLKIEHALRKIRIRETTGPADESVVNALRARMATLEATLQQLNKEINEIDILFTQIKENADLILFIEKKIQTISAQINELRRQLAEEESNRQPDREKIRQLQIQLERSQDLLRELKVDLEKAKGKETTLRQQQREAGRKKEIIENKRKQAREELGEFQQELEDTLRGDVRTGDETENKKRELEERKRRLRESLRVATNNLHTAVESIYVDPHPRNPLKNLKDEIPILLMPVRIETRFVTTGAASELWLRIYPDDIAIHTHEKTLTDKEVAEGKKYWKALFNAGKSGGQQKETLKKDAWSGLASIFGTQRAAWIANETKPLNWSDDLSGIDDVAQLDFPVHDLTTTNAWSRAPRTYVMPDKFVISLYEGESIAIEHTGNTIPDELSVGPDPLEAEEAFVNLEVEEKLVFGESYNWTSEFDKAVEKGMGFKIALSPQQAARGFDKIIALGLFLSTDENESQKAVEALIDNHHYSPKGFSILKQGTATNNTEQAGSGYTRNDVQYNTGYFTETGTPLFDDTDECDGKNLADALGIEYGPLQFVLNSDGTDHKEAVAMNTALYPSTLGYYFDTLLSPVLDDATSDQLRNFYLRHVSGRGSLPSIRVGDQPYGILLTSDFSKWRWHQHEPVWGTPFLDTLYKVLDNYQAIWKGLLNDLMYIGKPGTNHSEVLMNVLGLQAGSVSFYQRTAYSTDDLINREGFKFGERYFRDILNTLGSKNILINYFSGLGYDVTDGDGQLKVPQLLRLVFQHYHTSLDAANLIDNTPLSEKDQIRFYNENEQKNFIHWLHESETITALEKQDFGAGVKAPTSLLFMQLRRSLLLQLNNASVRWFKKNDIILDQVLKPMNFHNIRSGGDLTKWEVMKASVGNALPEHPQKALAVADYLLTSGNGEDEAVYLNKVKEALKFLADKPTARLERCFSEHLDTCNYRLDAWQSGLFDQRLQKFRKSKSSDGREQRVKGIYLGAYGWLENIRPDNKRQVVRDVPEKLRPLENAPVFEYNDNGGFVHAPSINHSLAAAVLRSGYMTHASAESPDTMAVNLSSERVRRSLLILQGIRNGQSLEALLGYQFERGLHDRGSENDSLKKLNEYIYNFRDTFPMEVHQVQQQGAEVATETIPANNVVNGVRLAETNLGFPYGATGSVVSASIEERTAVEIEKNKLDDTLDAVKDLLLSESIFQMVQGNPDRTGAVMNALKEARIPAELDVINTPRSSHFTFTNRVAINFETPTPGDAEYNPWPAVSMTPRATMEPGINKWLAKIIGEPEKLACLVSHKNNEDAQESEIITVNQLDLQPIDLIYIAGNELNTGIAQPGKENRTAASELESRIAFQYRKIKSLDDETPVVIEFLKPETDPGKRPLGRILPLLRMLKSLITDSRGLHAEDFDPPSKTSLADKTNPKGYDHAELLTRIQQAENTFHNYLNDLEAITITLNQIVEGVTGDLNLKEFFNLLDLTHSEVVEIDFSLSGVSVLQLQQVFVRIAGFGMPDTFPHVFSVAQVEEKAMLLEQARNTARRMNAIIQTADALIVEAGSPSITVERKIAKLTEAGKSFFGEAFNVLALFTYNNVQDIHLSNNDRVQLLKYAQESLKMNFVADEWLQNVAHVRPRLFKWECIRTLYESLHVHSPADNLLELKPIQVPYRAKDSWIAVEFPSRHDDDTPFNITHDTLSIVIHGGPSAFTSQRQGGILLDEWTETIPIKEEITGITFNYDQPNASPPQALLLAVPAVEKGSWDWDELVGILNDTFMRAKLRAVEPALLDKTNKPEVGVLLPGLLANFSEYDLDLALDYRMNVSYLNERIPVKTAEI